MKKINADYKRGTLTFQDAQAVTVAPLHYVKNKKF